MKIVGRLRLAEGEQTSEVTLDYVPATSHRRGGLFFTEDPRRYPLSIREEGYSQAVTIRWFRTLTQAPAGRRPDS